MVALSGMRVCRLCRGSPWGSFIRSCSWGLMPLVRKVITIRALCRLRSSVCRLLPAAVAMRKGNSPRRHRGQKGRDGFKFGARPMVSAPQRTVNGERRTRRYPAFWGSGRGRLEFGVRGSGFGTGIHHRGTEDTKGEWEMGFGLVLVLVLVLIVVVLLLGVIVRGSRFAVHRSRSGFGGYKRAHH